MRAVHLHALRALRRCAAERGAEHHADCDANGKPDANMSSHHPEDRKIAIAIFSMFIVASAVLTIFGSFFRGEGFNFVFPWEKGLFFDF